MEKLELGSEISRIKWDNKKEYSLLRHIFYGLNFLLLCFLIDDISNNHITSYESNYPFLGWYVEILEKNRDSITIVILMFFFFPFFPSIILKILLNSSGNPRVNYFTNYLYLKNPCSKRDCFFEGDVPCSEISKFILDKNRCIIVFKEDSDFGKSPQSQYLRKGFSINKKLNMSPAEIDEQLNLNIIG